MKCLGCCLHSWWRTGLRLGPKWRPTSLAALCPNWSEREEVCVFIDIHTYTFIKSQTGLTIKIYRQYSVVCNCFSPERVPVCSSCLDWASHPGPEDLVVGGAEGAGLPPGCPAGGRGAGGAAARPLLRLRPDLLQTHPLPGGGGWGRRGSGGPGEAPAAVRL